MTNLINCKGLVAEACLDRLLSHCFSFFMRKTRRRKKVGIASRDGLTFSGTHYTMLSLKV